MAGNKYYVVWKGFATGVFESWDEAQIQVSGYPDAQYRAFKTMDEAVEAFRQGYDQDGLIQEVKKQVAQLNKEGHKIVWNPEKSKNTSTSLHHTLACRGWCVQRQSWYRRISRGLCRNRTGAFSFRTYPGCDQQYHGVSRHRPWIGIPRKAESLYSYI